jgi:GxxExxY protein
MNVLDSDENEISKIIIGCAIEIHKNVGPGLLESAYESALEYELLEKGFNVKRQVRMPFHYKSIELETGYVIDLIINDLVLIEVKSVKELSPVHKSQTLTYLKLSGLKLGLLINFNSFLLKDGIKRIVNNF